MDITGIGSIADAVGTVVNKIWPDKTPIELAQIQAQLTVQLAQSNLVQGQINVNAEEAKNSSWWVAGGRPLFLWGGGGAFAYTYLLEPLLQAVSTFFHGPTLPPLHLDSVYTEVTLGLLGLDTSHMAFKHAVNNGVFSKN